MDDNDLVEFLLQLEEEEGIQHGQQVFPAHQPHPQGAPALHPHVDDGPGIQQGVPPALPHPQGGAPGPEIQQGVPPALPHPQGGAQLQPHVPDVQELVDQHEDNDLVEFFLQLEAEEGIQQGQQVFPAHQPHPQGAPAPHPHADDGPGIQQGVPPALPHVPDVQELIDQHEDDVQHGIAAVVPHPLDDFAAQAQLQWLPDVEELLGHYDAEIQHDIAAPQPLPLGLAAPQPLPLGLAGIQPHEFDPEIQLGVLAPQPLPHLQGIAGLQPDVPGHLEPEGVPAVQPHPQVVAGLEQHVAGQGNLQEVLAQVDDELQQDDFAAQAHLQWLPEVQELMGQYEALIPHDIAAQPLPLGLAGIQPHEFDPEIQQGVLAPQPLPHPQGIAGLQPDVPGHVNDQDLVGQLEPEGVPAAQPHPQVVAGLEQHVAGQGNLQELLEQFQAENLQLNALGEAAIGRINAMLEAFHQPVWFNPPPLATVLTNRLNHLLEIGSLPINDQIFFVAPALFDPPAEPAPPPSPDVIEIDHGASPPQQQQVGDAPVLPPQQVDGAPMPPPQQQLVEHDPLPHPQIGHVPIVDQHVDGPHVPLLQFDGAPVPPQQVDGAHVPPPLQLQGELAPLEHQQIDGAPVLPLQVPHQQVAGNGNVQQLLEQLQAEHNQLAAFTLEAIGRITAVLELLQEPVFYHPLPLELVLTNRLNNFAEMCSLPINQHFFLAPALFVPPVEPVPPPPPDVIQVNSESPPPIQESPLQQQPGNDSPQDP